MIISRAFRSAVMAALLITGMEAQATGLTKIFFSGYFSVSIPTESLDGATIFHSDGPGIKFSDGRHFAGALITREQESLGDEFELADYPLYLFGLKDTETLDQQEAEKFTRSLAELRASLGHPAFEQITINDATVYFACADRCEAIVVQHQQDEHLLHITSRGFSQSDLIAILQGGNDAIK
ncbi:MAG: hypothetical protein V7751_15540 [Pseudoalteromonas distincta]